MLVGTANFIPEKKKHFSSSCVSPQVCEVSKQIFDPGGTGTTSTHCLTQLSLPTLSKGTIHTHVNTHKLYTLQSVKMPLHCGAIEHHQSMSTESACFRHWQAKIVIISEKTEKESSSPFAWSGLFVIVSKRDISGPDLFSFRPSGFPVREILQTPPPHSRHWREVQVSDLQEGLQDRALPQAAHAHPLRSDRLSESSRLVPLRLFFCIKTFSQATGQLCVSLVRPTSQFGSFLLSHRTVLLWQKKDLILK